MRRLLCLVLLLVIFCSPHARAEVQPAPASSSAAAATAPLHPAKGEGDSAVLVANLMTRYHYHAQPLDDAMSSKILAAYIEALDSQKLYFTQKDIDTFGQWQHSLDDAIWDGKMDAAFTIFNRYRSSMAQRIANARQLLVKGFDFAATESYQLDRSEAPWAADEAALDELWRKRVKNDWLRLSLAGKKDAAIRELLDKRYAGYLRRMQQVKAADVFQSFMNAYASSTDPHTGYLGPRAAENFDIAMKLSLEGIGAVLEMRGEYTQIRELVPGGPASKSGRIHPGDRIIGVGQGSDGAVQDVVGWRLDDVVQKIRGKKGSTVRLEILPAEAGLDGQHETVALVRDKVSIVGQAAKKSLIEVEREGVAYKVGVIELPSFYQDFAAHAHGQDNFRSASRDVARLIGELKAEGIAALIVDLRNNGGGSLAEATRLTGLFIDTGPVVQVRDWRGKVDAQGDDDPGMVWDGPLAVLVNRGSASASEIFTAAIQDYGRGLVIGSDTFGKGTVQNLINLNNVARDGSDQHGELKMTIAQFFRIDGGSTQLRGVSPDIAFPTTIDKDDFGESSYKNALAWSSISPADYKPVADAVALLPMLQQAHAARVAKDPEWQLRSAELALAAERRQRTVVSLNLEQRRAERKAYDARREALIAKYRGGDHQPASSGSTAPAKAASVAAASSISALVPDDGLQADERSLKTELAREKAAEEREDVRLTEVAHILADVVAAVREQPKLAATVLPAAATEPVTVSASH